MAWPDVSKRLRRAGGRVADQRLAVPTSTTETAANALKDIAKHRRQTNTLSLALGLRAIGGKLDFVTPGRMRATLPVFLIFSDRTCD